METLQEQDLALMLARTEWTTYSVDILSLMFPPPKLRVRAVTPIGGVNWPRCHRISICTQKCVTVKKSAFLVAFRLPTAKFLLWVSR